VALTAAQVAVLYAARLGCLDATTAVLNIALARIGVSQQIVDLETDTTEAAIQARLHVTQDIETVLRDGDWPFATRYAALTLVGGTATAAVNDDWQFSYRLPDDCVKARRLVSTDAATQRRYNEFPPAFKIGSDDTGPLLYTNLDEDDQDDEEVRLEYTVRVACPCSQGDALFRSALAWKFAHSLAAPLAKIKDIVGTCWAAYQFDLNMAKTVSGQEEQRQDTGDDEPWTR
jgi:hypothetical protein